MGYTYYELPIPATGRLMKRGYGVRCKCHQRGCNERIDRGLAYLCYNCTWYFCYEHLTFAVDVYDEPLLAECFAGQGSQVCQGCKKRVEAWDIEQRITTMIDFVEGLQKRTMP